MNDYAGYTIKWVTLPWEREQAYALRRQVFCREQGLFADDDRDEIDDHAHLLVALGCVAGCSPRSASISSRRESGWGRGWRWTPPIAARGSWGRR